MRIGILTLFYGNINWGGVLQGYALKTAIEQLAMECGCSDCQVELVDYAGGENPVYPTLRQQMSQYSLLEITSRVFKMIGRKLRRGKQAPLAERKRRFYSFMEALRVDARGYADSQMEELSQNFDILISGSDQVWNPNAVRRGFLQMDVVDPCKRVAYAASISRDALSKSEQEVMLPAIRRFHAVSVRERTAKQFLDTYFGGEVTVEEVLDPTLLLDKQAWEQLAPSSQKEEPPYAVCFFFSDSLAYRQNIEKYCEAHRLHIKIIPHAAGKYLESDESGAGERLYDLGPRDFVGLMQNASVVFTDSFHGTVFSMIFEKPFCVFERDKKGKTSKNSRLYDLLGNFDLNDRLIRGTDEALLEKVLSHTIDYETVASKLESRRAASIRFLLDAFGWKKGTPISSQPSKSITIVKPAACTGCGACQAVCPKGVIAMVMDDEGFLRPQVNLEGCIACGICQTVCPSLSSVVTETPSAYLAYSLDPQVRKNSSSGGMFYHLAKRIIDAGGVVWGAAFTKEHDVMHVRATTMEEVVPLLTSKYLQSNCGEAYTGVLADLKAGKQVLFCGTPCQVVALSRVAERMRLREHLVLVDFICHGVPSPGVWKSYLHYLSEKHNEILSATFRDKCRGWHDFSITIDFTSGKQVSESHETNAYMRVFLRDLCLRASCYQCPAKGERYASDLTLADAWKVEKTNPELADDKGTSLVIVRSQRGQEVFDSLNDSIKVVETDYEAWKKYNPSLVSPTVRTRGRTVFFSRYAKLGSRVWNEYQKMPLKGKIRYCFKCTLKMFHLDRIVRRKY